MWRRLLPPWSSTLVNVVWLCYTCRGGSENRYGEKNPPSLHLSTVGQALWRTFTLPLWKEKIRLLQGSSLVLDSYQPPLFFVLGNDTTESLTYDLQDTIQKMLSVHVMSGQTRERRWKGLYRIKRSKFCFETLNHQLIQTY